MFPSVKKVSSKDEFYHVRFRPESQFTRIRTPNWAETVSESVSEGSKVRMGRTQAGNWLVQTVLIKKTMSAKKAMNQAQKVVSEIEG